MQRSALVALAVVLVSSTVGCGPPPSLRTRWSVVDREDRDDNGELDVLQTTAAQVCSELGINTVRVRIIDEAGDIVDDAYHACFARGFDDAEQTVAGPALAAGTYAVEVRGVQRDLEPWEVTLAAGDALRDCDTNDPTCDPRDISCDCTVFDARDDHTERLVDFEISAPDECIDGIDNDRDGVLDAEDPSCGLPDVPGTEGKPVTKAQFRVLMSLFGGNDVVSCGGLGLIDVRARLCAREDGAESAPCPEDGPDAAVLTCRTGSPLFFEATLEQRSYTLELVVRGPQGTVRTAPRLFPMSFGNGAGAVVPIEVDFAASTFDPAIEASAGFDLSYQSGDDSRGCAALAGTNDATITSVELEVLDAHGGTLATPATLADGTPLDGGAIECPTMILRTLPLAWGGYSLRASAMTADGTVCFSTDGTGPNGTDAPLLLAPTDIALVLPALLDATGEPPDGCVVED